MFVRDVAGNRQSQSTAARLPRTGRFKTIERIEDSFHLRFRNTRSAVCHTNGDTVCLATGGDACIAAVLHGIVDQIVQTALQGTGDRWNGHPRLPDQGDVMARIDRIGANTGKQ